MQLICSTPAQDHAVVISDPRTPNGLSFWAAAAEYFYSLISDVAGCYAYRICSPRWRMTVSLDVFKAINCRVDKAKSEIHSYTGY